LRNPGLVDYTATISVRQARRIRHSRFLRETYPHNHRTRDTPCQTSSAVSWACRNTPVGLHTCFGSGYRFLGEPRAARRVDPGTLFLILVSHELRKRWLFPEKGESKVSRKKKSGLVLRCFMWVRYATKNSFMRFLPDGVARPPRFGPRWARSRRISFTLQGGLHEEQLFTQKVPLS
jgi:hypothetical protein